MRLQYPEHVREMIPRGIADQYVSRKVGPSKDVPDTGLLSFAQDEHHNVLLTGPTGSGKTMLPMAYAEQTRQPYLSIDCNGAIDPTQVIGKHTQDAKGRWGFTYGGLPIIVEWGGVLVIEEINMMPPKIAAMFYPLLDARRIIRMTYNQGEIIRADQPWDEDDPDGERRDLLIVATMNEGYRGTNELNAALRNRFPLQLDWGYDDETESRLIVSSELREVAGRIRESNDFVTPLSTNRLRMFEQLVFDIGFDFAVSNLLAAYPSRDRQAVASIIQVSRERLLTDYRSLVAIDPEKGTAFENYGWENGDSDA